MTFVEPELSDRTITLTGVPAAWGRMSSQVKELPRPGVLASKILHRSAWDRHAVPISAPVTAAIPLMCQVCNIGTIPCARASCHIMSFSMCYTSHTCNRTHPDIHVIFNTSQTDKYREKSRKVVLYHTGDVNPQSNGSKSNWHLGQSCWEGADRRRVAAGSVRAIPESQGVASVNPCVSCTEFNISIQTSY